MDARDKPGHDEFVDTLRPYNDHMRDSQNANEELEETAVNPSLILFAKMAGSAAAVTSRLGGWRGHIGGLAVKCVASCVT